MKITPIAPTAITKPTDSVTDNPDVAPTEPEETDTPADDETAAPVAEGGCDGSVSLAGIALVAALGACTAFVAKKKEN